MSEELDFLPSPNVVELDEPVAVLDDDVPDPTVALEELVDVSLACVAGDVPQEHPAERHCKGQARYDVGRPILVFGVLDWTAMETAINRAGGGGRQKGRRGPTDGRTNERCCWAFAAGHAGLGGQDVYAMHSTTDSAIAAPHMTTVTRKIAANDAVGEEAGLVTLFTKGCNRKKYELRKIILIRLLLWLLNK